MSVEEEKEIVVAIEAQRSKSAFQKVIQTIKDDERGVLTVNIMSMLNLEIGPNYELEFILRSPVISGTGG